MNYMTLYDLYQQYWVLLFNIVGSLLSSPS